MLPIFLKKLCNLYAVNHVFLFFCVHLNVKKSLSILLLSVYLLTSTQMAELIKIPVLVGHYMEHREYGQLSFYQFLNIHYNCNEPHHAIHKSDSKLPFMTYQGTSSFAVFLTPVFQEIQKEASVIYPDPKGSYFTYSFFYSSTFHSSIWQPPRQC